MSDLDTFTAERLEDFICQPLENGLTRGEQMALARIALSVKGAKESHSRREVWGGGNTWIQCSRQAYDRHEAAGNRVRVLYERPQLNSLEIPEGWIKCSDQDPAESGPYWCWFGNEKSSVIQQRVCMFSVQFGEWCDSAVTHWMPLPAAPEKPL